MYYFGIISNFFKLRNIIWINIRFLIISSEGGGGEWQKVVETTMLILGLSTSKASSDGAYGDKISHESKETNRHFSKCSYVVNIPKLTNNKLIIWFIFTKK